jgi:riboflavin kinase/FMN adenylyltransferase
MVIMKNKVLALGYFDAIHIGHQMLLKKARLIANESGSELLVCTFGDDFYTSLGKRGKEVFLLSERKKIFSRLGYDNILIFDTTKEFFNKTKEEFLQYLLNLDPSAIVVGFDYRFGKNASGSILDLKQFFIQRDIKVEVTDLLYEDGEKISTTLIKSLLTEGEIVKTNRLLGFEYFISGKVKKGRQVGSTLGIPTANIDIKNAKLAPKAGVYVTKVDVLGKIYSGITNIGEHPTFFDNNFNVETYIFDFDGDIYSKDVEIYLIKYVREIIQFDDKDKLIEQINRDIIFAKEEVIND